MSSTQAVTLGLIEATEVVRTRTYPNSRVEGETIATVDQYVTDLVVQHEAALTDQAAAHIQSLSDLGDEVTETVAVLERVVVAAKRGEADLEEAQSLFARARQLDVMSASEITRVENTKARLTDPLSSLDSLFKKYPALNRPTMPSF